MDSVGNKVYIGGIAYLGIIILSLLGFIFLLVITLFLMFVLYP